MIYILLYTAASSCDHDKFQHLFDFNYTSPPSEEKMRRLRTTKSVEFKPIRITMDYGFIDGTKEDPMMCKPGMTTVTWGRTRYPCDSADMLNSTHINAIKGTMDNVKSFFERLLKVDPVVGGFTLRKTSDAPGIAAGEKVYNTDLHITVIVRPFAGTSPVAQAGPINTEYGSMRALQGLVYLNPRHAPTEVQNENTRNNMYFNVVIHELFHVLGITNQRYQYYHPKGSYEYYNNPTCELTKNGKHFSILTTPYAHKQAVRMYGDEIWTGDDGTQCKSGIIIEDNGGAGTAGSHPEAIIYFNDLMVGMTLQGNDGPFSRLTDVSLSFLLDTGNFEVNWKLAQPLIYGNKDAIDGKKIEGWPLSPPMTTFPDYFYNMDKPTISVGFEYNWWSSGTNLVRIPCPNGGEYSLYCNAQGYYNPLNLDYAGNIGPFDFQPIPMPSMVCPEGKATIPGLTYYGNDECAEYECNGYDNFSISLVTQVDINKIEKFTCTQKGQVIQYTKKLSKYRYYQPRDLICPSPEQFCRTRKMLKEHFTQDPFTGEDLVDSPTPSPETSNETNTPLSESASIESSPAYVPTPDPTPEETPVPTPERTRIITPKPTPTPWYWPWWPWGYHYAASDSNDASKQGTTPENSQTPNKGLSLKAKYIIFGVTCCGIAIIAGIVFVVVMIIKRRNQTQEEPSDDNTENEVQV